MAEMQKELDFKQKVIEELTNSRNKLRKEKILERKNNDLVNRLEFNLDSCFSNLTNDKQQRLDLAQAHLKALNPLNKLANQRQQVSQLQHQLRQAIKTKVRCCF